MIRLFHELWSPAGFSKKEKKEYRLGMLLCIAASAMSYMVMVMAYD